ncbi:DUF72 domain-containing protein [Myxococcota bacterium]|nr:DUF72 domain-containing protein [Myxococcota bacterium]
MKLRAGTSGYSYKEWKGSFYPDDLPASAMLGFYAARFGSVEINNTFYRMPNKGVLEKWSSEVPDDFTFVLKASQRITHQKRLKDAGDEVKYFLETAAVLGPKLGPVLFQLPPNAKKNAERLATFLELLPKGQRVAFEFRHPSWLDEEVFSLLRGAGAALCYSDAEDDDDAAAEPAAAPVEPQLVATAPFGYLRLRRCLYEDGALGAWAARIKAQPWDEVFVFFKHEDEATGPKLAQRFIEVF